MIPELFVIPTPVMNIVLKSSMIVNALACGLNTMPLTSISNSLARNVSLECANVAVSAGPLGTVAGFQLLTLFQFPSAFAFQVALPAKVLLAVERMSVSIAAAEGRKARTMERSGDCILSRWKDLRDRSDCIIFIVITSSC